MNIAKIAAAVAILLSASSSYADVPEGFKLCAVKPASCQLKLPSLVIFGTKDWNTAPMTIMPPGIACTSLNFSQAPTAELRYCYARPIVPQTDVAVSPVAVCTGMKNQDPAINAVRLEYGWDGLLYPYYMVATGRPESFILLGIPAGSVYYRLVGIFPGGNELVLTTAKSWLNDSLPVTNPSNFTCP